MNTYNVEYTIGNSGDPIIEQITTNSEENAKKIMEVYDYEWTDEQI